MPLLLHLQPWATDLSLSPDRLSPRIFRGIWFWHHWRFLCNQGFAVPCRRTDAWSSHLQIVVEELHLEELLLLSHLYSFPGSCDNFLASTIFDRRIFWVTDLIFFTFSLMQLMFVVPSLKNSLWTPEALSWVDSRMHCGWLMTNPT